MSRLSCLAILLGIGGVVELLVGLGLLVAPGGLAAFLLRASLDGSGSIMARIAGGGLLSLALLGALLAPQRPTTKP